MRSMCGAEGILANGSHQPQAAPCPRWGQNLRRTLFPDLFLHWSCAQPDVALVFTSDNLHGVFCQGIFNIGAQHPFNQNPVWVSITCFRPFWPWMFCLIVFGSSVCFLDFTIFNRSQNLHLPSYAFFSKVISRITSLPVGHIYMHFCDFLYVNQTIGQHIAMKQKNWKKIVFGSFNVKFCVLSNDSK